jgi:hypothetical protein
MSRSRRPVTIVNACLRNGRGGSPTAVLDDTALTDDERRAVPALTGTSHAVFVSAEGSGPDGADASLRFFTATGELPACGHGTVAALAFLAERADEDDRITIRVSGRACTGGSRGRTASSGPRSTRGPSRCAGPERATTSLSSTPWASARMGPPAAPASPHWGARGCSSPCPRDPFSPAWPRTRTGFATGATAWGCWGATCSARRRPEAASRPVCSPRPWVSRRTSPTSTAPPASPPTWPARMPPRSPSTWATPSAPPTITAAAWRRETARLVRVGGAARIERVVRL